MTILAVFCSCACRVVPHPIGNLKDTFCHDEAHFANFPYLSVEKLNGCDLVGKEGLVI